ncbi:MAG: carboxylate-amine ligase, partial [Erythrobacter sp.]
EAMREHLEFVRNEWPSLGVEIELQLIDAQTLALRNAINDVLPEVPPELSGRVKPEIMQSYLEINTEICQTAADVGKDLAEKLRVVEGIVERHGLRLFWAGTHPFSKWSEQRVTPDDRYYGLVDLLQDTARRLVTFGLHVHVGVDSGDKAIMICDRILRHLPTLLALSAKAEEAEGHRPAWPWWLLSGIFAVLALDEVAMLHELSGRVLERLVPQIDALGPAFHYAWTLVAIPGVLLLAVVLAPWFFALGSRTRLLFGTSAVMFLGGAVGLEMVNSALDAQIVGRNLAYSLTTVVEESLEFTGVLLFQFALLRHLSTNPFDLAVDLR